MKTLSRNNAYPQQNCAYVDNIIHMFVEKFVDNVDKYDFLRYYSKYIVFNFVDKLFIICE